MQVTGKRIMVTGAAGFIGSHLSDRLALNNELLLVDDFSVGTRENLEKLVNHPHVEIVEADVSDGPKMDELMASGIDIVFHLAMSCLRTSINQPFMSHDVNAGGTLCTCLAARDHHVQRFIYVSSSEIYGTAETAPMSESHPCKPTTVYGASKLAGELYALSCWRAYKLPVSVVRPFNTYGPRSPYEGPRAEVIPRFVIQMEHSQPPVIHGDGSQTRDFTYVDDTVSGLVQAAECDELVGDIVNIAYGVEVSINRIAELIAREMGDGSHPAIHTEPRPGAVDRHYADINKSQRLFGFEPRIDIEKGLALTIEWCRANEIAKRVPSGVAGAPNW